MTLMRTHNNKHFFFIILLYVRADQRSRNTFTYFIQLAFFFSDCWSKNSFRVTFSPTIHDFIHQRERYLLSNLIPILRKVVSVFRVSSLLCEHLKSMHVVILECYVYFEQS